VSYLQYLISPSSFNVAYHIPYDLSIPLYLKQITKHNLSPVTDATSSEFKYAPQGSLGGN
jgi:hypothetical protein